MLFLSGESKPNRDFVGDLVEDEAGESDWDGEVSSSPASSAASLALPPAVVSLAYCLYSSAAEELDSSAVEVVSPSTVAICSFFSSAASASPVSTALSSASGSRAGEGAVSTGSVAVEPPTFPCEQ